MMVANFGKERDTVWKPDNTPLTETDTAINRHVIESVQAAFPDDGILGEEESYEAWRRRLWVVDPIDGTQPFDAGAPLSTFCLSLVIEGQPVLGLINHPFGGHLYWAAAGQGAFVNERRLHVSAAQGLDHNYVMLSSRMHSDELKTTGQIFDSIEQCQGKSFNFRSFAYGSTFVAAGKAVAAVIGVPNAWDVAATKIIVEEAGGKVTDVFGNPRRYDGDGPGLIASNGLVHAQILELMKRP